MALAHDRAGAGPPLVLLHPLGADRRVWDPVLPRLRVERTVMTIDLPGFGQSPPILDEVPTPRVIADAVVAELATLGLDAPPHVAGNSLGGWVALELALRGAAASVTAIAPAGLWTSRLLPKPPLAHRIGAMLTPLAAPLLTLPAGREALLQGSMAHPSRMSAGDALHLVRAWASAPGFNAVNAAMRAGRFVDLAEIACPVTLVWPEHDRLVRRPRQLPGNVRNVEIPGAGHIPMWDEPDAIADALLAGSREAAPAS